jgi:hypothetical protein
MKTFAGAALAVVGVLALTYGLVSYEAHQPTAPDSVNLGVALPSATAVFETSLQDRISSTDTSMSIVSASVRGGGTLSGYQCFTVDEGRSDAEFVCGTLSGTTVSGLERGIDPLTGTSSVAALKFAHRKGADVKITDFPLVERLRNQANGVETYPNLLSYESGTACSGSSPNDTICDKAYVDGVAVSGASNANETTKGIAELATQVEMASSTNLGSTGASLVLQSRYSTSSPYTAGLWNVITQNNGKISQLFFDLAQGFTWTGTHVWSGGGAIGIGTTSPYAPFAYVSSRPAVFSTIFATSTASGNATSTFAGNLTVSNNASTSRLTISNYCNGCNLASTTRGTSSGSVSNGQQFSATATCPAGKIAISGGWEVVSGVGANETILFNGPKTPNAATSNEWYTLWLCGSGTCTYSVITYAVCVNP